MLSCMLKCLFPSRSLRGLDSMGRFHHQLRREFPVAHLPLRFSLLYLLCIIVVCYHAASTCKSRSFVFQVLVAAAYHPSMDCCRFAVVAASCSCFTQLVCCTSLLLVREGEEYRASYDHLTEAALSSHPRWSAVDLESEEPSRGSFSRREPSPRGS
mmetsp:Transcript_24444/g.74594  ORF Transcript_24444/g.74594 Transcript_24444/m.74594 type:complete len:156 (-) Transcript_24444:139-606(-)